SLRMRVPSYNSRSSYFASVHKYFELEIDLLMRLHERRPSEGFDTRALAASELARARSLLEMLTKARADIHRGAAPELLAEEQRLRRVLNSKAERQMNLLSAPHSGEQAEAAEKEIQGLTAQYEDVEAQIRRQSPLYASLSMPQPLSTDDIRRQLLDDDTLLLEYALGDERSYLWVVSSAGVESFAMPARAEIENAAQRFYRLLTAAQMVPGETPAERSARSAEAEAQLPSEAAALGRTLLGPVAAKLGTRRLLIVTDGALQYIPFQALVVPDEGARGRQSDSATQAGVQTPLLLDHEVINEPSAAALALLSAETARRTPPT